MPATYDVLVLGGRIFCDLIFTGLPQLPQLGEEIHCRKLTMTAGGSANTTVALRRLGLRPGLLADVGADLFSQFVVNRLHMEDVDTALIQQHDFSAAAVTAAFPVESERAMATYVEGEDLPPYSGERLAQLSARHLHVCGIGVGLHHLEFVQAADAAGLTISLDCAWERVDMSCPDTHALLAATDYILPNAAEARTLAGVHDVRAAGEVLAGYGPTPVIKLGPAGTIAYAGSEWLAAPGIAVQPVDTTGAGDCFAAGFILGLHEGRSLAECLRYGNVAGGLSTLGGGATAAPTRAQLAAYLESNEVA